MQKITKTRLMLISICLILVISLTETFAFEQFGQGAFNVVWDGEIASTPNDNYGGRVHDDFEDREGPGHYDKDIFVENFGERDLFVRIQLREFLSINDIAIGGTSVGLTTVSNPTTWPIYEAEANSVHLRRVDSPYAYYIGLEGIQWTLGHASDVQKIFMPTHNHVTRPVDPENILSTIPAPFNDPNVYRFSNTTGRGVDRVASDFAIGAQTSAEDIHESGIQTGSHISDGTHDFWSLAGSNSYSYSYRFYINEAGELTKTPTRIRHEARETLVADFDGIMTLTQWDALERPNGNFWIMDTENPGGWFYWNGYLSAGEATSLLLNGIYIPDRSEAWQYIIHMSADFFTWSSIDDLEGGISNAAREIFNHLPSASTETGTEEYLF